MGVEAVAHFLLWLRMFYRDILIYNFVTADHKTFVIWVVVAQFRLGFMRPTQKNQWNYILGMVNFIR